MKKKSTRPKRRSDPAELSQAPDLWGVGVEQLRIWIVPEDEAPRRPYMMLVLDLGRGFILGNELFEEPPGPAEIQHALAHTMLHPLQKTVRPRRPTQVLFADPALTEAISPYLADLSIACETQDLPMVPEIAREVETSMREGKPEHPGLLSVAGVTPELARGLFAAAADFYRAAPWVQLENEHILAIRFPAQNGPTWFTIVMGNGGVEYGLAVYRDWPDVEKLFTGLVDHPREKFSGKGELALFYEGVQNVPFEDYEAIEKYGWEVADEQAYPTPIFIQRYDDFRRPNVEELAWLEAALRAIPQVAREHLCPDGRGGYQPFDLMLPVATHAGEAQVQVKFPAGVLVREDRPMQDDLDWTLDEEADDETADEEDEIPVFDRRLMESSMAQMLGAEGNLAIQDRKLRQAQGLMYKAWEETDPAKRLTLAHEALAISDKCADAYVLLAEEQSDTVGRALEYYQRGVEAGERALGKEYFEEAVGDFWDLLETRPYMRARQGVADCLLKLNRFDEAIAHYRELLRLNPDDNQGIRYVLLSILADLNRDTQAVHLLKQYEDDGMADWLYTWALVEFRLHGASKTAERRLEEALEGNSYVPAYLTGRKRVPNRLPPYIGLGDDNEAAHYAGRNLNHWRRTPGAVEWLKSKI